MRNLLNYLNHHENRLVDKLIFRFINMYKKWFFINRFVSILQWKPILQLGTLILIIFDYLLALHSLELKALMLPLILIYPCEWFREARQMQQITRQTTRSYLAPIQLLSLLLSLTLLQNPRSLWVIWLFYTFALWNIITNFLCNF